MSDSSFWKNLILSVIFFTITPITLGVSLFSLSSLSSSNKKSGEVLAYQSSVIRVPESGVKVYASLPSSFPSVSGEVESKDARSEIIRQYLEYYNSPLVPYSDLIVATADKYGLDYRLITAIAQKESNLCKIIPPDSYNCWGWGIHSKGTLKFSSYEEGIETVSEGIRQNYIDKGYTTISDIMGKYTPLSNGSWATGVIQFMKQMQ